MSDDVTITVRVNNQTAAGFRDVNGQLRSLDGRFAATGNNVRRSSSAMSQALVDVKASLLSLAPAAVPVAASLAPIAAHAAGAGVAMAAFGAAVIPQISNLKDAAAAQTKYTDAVTKYGAGSKQAITAQQQAAQVLAGMPKATQQAAAAYSVLGGKFKDFSDSTARFTMAPVEHSFAVLGTVIPKLTPMVQSSSTQLDRLVKVAGGAVNTSGFDSLSKKVSDFANQSLKNATDEAIHFIRVMSEGNASGPLTEFMAYAKAQGPAVKELLSNLVQALGNIAQGAADAGPGLLTVVNAFAKMVAAVPPELIGNLMQVYAAFKLIKLAGAGIGAAAGGVQTLAGKVAGLQAASAAAGGGVAGLKAAFVSLGTVAKATVVVAGITLLVVALSKLSNIGKQAPPDVDRMATSITNLGRTGKVSGEALRVFGKDLGGLADSLRTLSRPSNLDSTQQFLTSLVGMDSTPVKEAKENLDSVDKALAGLVKGGKADLAKAAFDDIAKAMEKQGLSSKELRGQLDDYKSALEDQALEARLTAESQGLFGQAALDTSAKLNAQKASADGLRQSIQALNDVNRQGLGGMIGFEAAIDAAATAAKDNAGALSMSGGVLNLNSEKARNAASALQDLADKTDSAAAANRESTGSWEGAIAIYNRGRAKLIESAQAMGLTKTEAKALADQILKIPDKTAKFKMDTEDARAGLESFNAAVKRSPGSHKVTLTALSKGAEEILESFGLKVKRLPNGKVTVTTKNGQSLAAIANVAAALNRLNGKTATTYTFHKVSTTYVSDVVKGKGSLHDALAAGGRVRGYAGGGNLQHFPDGGYVQGPGTPTSDSIFATFGSGAAAAVSDTEYVVKAAAVRKYGVKMLDALNQGQLPVMRLAKGGVTKAEAEARREARGDLTVSHFGQMAGYSRSEFASGLGSPDSVSSLVGALNQWRGVILKATHGGQEKSLLRALDSSGKKLLSWEKQLGAVTKSLESAKNKLNDLKSAASQLSESVKSGVLSSAAITKGASGDGLVTTSSVMAGLTASRDKATAFSSALAQLKEKGLRSDLIQQIGEAGVEGGGLETAGALLGASSSEISSINDLQRQIRAAATSAGKVTSDAVYAAQIKAQDALVKKLGAQQDRLVKSMDKLTASMEKAIERAFGRKAAGGIVGAAASGGVRGGLTWVGEHEPELLQLPVGSRVWSGPDSRRKAAEAAPWASMLTAPRRPAAGYASPGPAAAASGGQPLVIQLRIGEREFGEVWVDVGRKAVRDRGGIEATLRPPRGR
ncbi:phage tail protein [Streptomyces griseorubiginosus]|uniref:phage tail protein n=1 Tax=Streptomyces griseorubiginosus TaxID=67304 RepID=UPI0036EECEB8